MTARSVSEPSRPEPEGNSVQLAASSGMTSPVALAAPVVVARCCTPRPGPAQVLCGPSTDLVAGVGVHGGHVPFTSRTSRSALGIGHAVGRAGRVRDHVVPLRVVGLGVDPSTTVRSTPLPAPRSAPCARRPSVQGRALPAAEFPVDSITTSAPSLPHQCCRDPVGRYRDRRAVHDQRIRVCSTVRPSRRSGVERKQVRQRPRVGDVR